MKNIVLLLIILISIFGCGTPMPNTYRMLDTSYKEHIDDNYAIICVYYPEDLSVQAPCYVLEDGNRVSVIKQGTYTEIKSKKGTHIYALENDSHIMPKVFIDANIKTVYYLKAGQVSDFLTAHATLELSTRESAMSQLPILKKIINNKCRD